MVNNCDIRIELDEAERTYEAGDTVTGTVHVEVNDDCQCDDLLLSLEWYTHGRGNAVDKRVGQQSLFQGEWTAGEHYQYDFETTMPPGPYTYHGNSLNVDWRLTAEADIPWAIDPSTKHELLLEPSGSEQEVRVGDEDSAEYARTMTDDGQTISWSGVWAGGFILGFGLLMGGIFMPMLPGPGKMIFGILSLLIVTGGGILLYRSIRNVFAEKRLGEVDVQLDSTEVSPGETLRCRVAMEPPSPVEVNEITVRLHGYERVVSGHGTNETTYTHTVHDETTTIRGAEQATIRGGLRTFKTDVALPDSAPFSFHAQDNEVVWDLKVQIDVPNWPDWSHTDPLTVRPGKKP